MSRREARERALSLLYEADTRGVSGGAVIAESPVAPDAFSAELVASVDRHRQEIDDVLAPHLHGWTLDRLPMIDRITLELAVGELLFSATPTGVVVSEAVELAKRYSTDDSGRFVNGVLGTVASEVRSTSDP